MVRSRTQRERVWAQIRRGRRVDVQGLISVTGCSEASIVSYLRFLTLCGILRKLDRREPGTAVTSPGFVRWLLIRDLGPVAPIWRPKKQALHDPNSGEAIVPEGVA
ncbi:MAG: hypothetical protein KDH19_01270 [Geminicoccaceae bacterium]|nr:hypothetical protein [Geminicoccaceae bacterium]